MLRIDQLPHTAFLICKSSHRPEIRRKLCFYGIRQALFIRIRGQIDPSAVLQNCSRLLVKYSRFVYIFRTFRARFLIDPHRIGASAVTDTHRQYECRRYSLDLQRNVQSSQ